MNSLIVLVFCILTIPIFTTSNVAKLPNCADRSMKQGLVLVNTLDGKLSVLDFFNNGKELWSIETGPGPMLSSNIHRLELTNNGHWVRMIPSLSGSLYKFNGDTIDAIPITADSLLTSSFRYSDDLVIAGGKEIRTYGVALNSGALLYECSLNGCINKTSNKNYEDLVLIERNTQTVRAVEPTTGLERWNFSVGQLDVKFPQAGCRSSSQHDKTVFNIKTVIPEGLIHAFSESNQIIWQKKFSTPIVNVWTWDGYTLEIVDLFSNSHFSWSTNNINGYISPALYLGMHNKQLYVHESISMQQMLTTNTVKNRNRLAEMKSVAKIPWKPFPATSSALTILNSQQSKDTNELEGPNQIMTTALSVLYGSEYVNGNGYYLYQTDETNALLCDNITIEDNVTIEDPETILEEDTPVQVMIVSLWYWWKEVTVIAITTAFALNILINQRLLIRHRTGSEVVVVERPVPMQAVQVDVHRYAKSYSESSDKEFTSRYLTDFDPLHCLGKGGFGIVFEARNKIDECNYAVKRITLPNKKESRDRVMREVRALAKLDHRNIVRYFNAWLESPPQEWIDAFDSEWSEDALSSEGLLEYSTRSIVPKKKGTSCVIDITKSNSSKLYDLDDLKCNRLDDSDSFIVFEDSRNKNSDATITKRSNHSNSDEIDSDIKQTWPLSENSKRAIQTDYDSGKVFLYIQMQLCQKESLRDWLRKNESRDTTTIITIFEQIVSAVEYVHLKGLIHRDLKPSNIFFSLDDEIKVGDFGLVTAMEECAEEDDNIKADKQWRKHTDAVGTQLYMSPEQLLGQSYNFKVDIYSLGVILFELLVPFHTVMERHKTLCNLRKNNFPSTFCQIYKNEHKLLSLMLSEQPDLRPPTSEIRARPPLARDPSHNCD